MAIKREVVTNSQIYQVYSSEKQERMRLYFELNDKYQDCVQGCPSIPIPSQKNHQCYKSCNQIFNDYASTLYEKYKETPEKLDEVVKDLPSFTTKTRTDNRGFIRNLFGQ